MDIDCPFCSFHACDTIYIVEHIEVYHPENKHGFSDAERIPGRFTPEKCLEEGSEFHDDDSEIEYVQCECGENVQLSEFTNHLALHMSEEMISYANLSQAEEYRDSSIQAISSTESTTDTRSHLRTSSTRKKTGKHADHSEQRKVSHSKQRMKGRSPGSFSSHARPSVAKPRHGAPRRLGVGWLLDFIAKHRLIILVGC